MLITNAYIYRNQTHRFEYGNMLIRDGEIVALDLNEIPLNEEIWDLDGKAVVPGLVDIHTHGRAGMDFNRADEKELAAMARSYAERGVTGVMPTLASDALEQMYAAHQRIASFAPDQGEASFLGVHWEGRYINPAKKGAHAPEHLSALRAEELDHPCFRMPFPVHITGSFELDTDGSFAAKALSLGATLSLGHTAATYREAVLAESRGVSAYTHLFNTMPPLHHREGGAVAAALTGDAYTELICDGIHVAEEMVRLTYRAKGSERLVLITDSMEAAGCPDGNYAIAGNAVTVKDGKATLADGVLAGSTLNLDDAVRNLMRMCKIPLTEAILCATENPARAVGVFDRVGSLDVGKQADLLVLADQTSLSICDVMLRGELVSKNVEADS